MRRLINKFKFGIQLERVSVVLGSVCLYTQSTYRYVFNIVITSYRYSFSDTQSYDPGCNYTVRSAAQYSLTSQCHLKHLTGKVHSRAPQRVQSESCLLSSCTHLKRSLWVNDFRFVSRPHIKGISFTPLPGTHLNYIRRRQEDKISFHFVSCRQRA